MNRLHISVEYASWLLSDGGITFGQYEDNLKQPPRDVRHFASNWQNHFKHSEYYAENKMILNTSQRKNLADLMAANGFAADEFQLRDDASTRACPNYGEEYKLTGTNYYFRVFLSESLYSHHEQFWVEYSPGEKQLKEYDSCWNWETVVREFEKYLCRLKSELATGDPWIQPGVTRIVRQQQGQTLIPAGNEFTGQRLARLVFATAKKSLDVLDPYIGPELLDRIDDADIKASVRLLTSKKHKLSLSYFQTFQKRYSNVELRVLPEDKLHDRFIIIDGKTAYHVGHSIKDLGKKDTNVSPMENVDEVKKLFAERWGEAKPIEC